MYIQVFARIPGASPVAAFTTAALVLLKKKRMHSVYKYVHISCLKVHLAIGCVVNFLSAGLAPGGDFINLDFVQKGF
jgi:hypothetical protein